MTIEVLCRGALSRVRELQLCEQVVSRGPQFSSRLIAVNKNEIQNVQMSMIDDKPNRVRVVPPLQSRVQFARTNAPSTSHLMLQDARTKPVQVPSQIAVIFAAPLSFSIVVNSVRSITPKAEPGQNGLRFIRKGVGTAFLAVAIASVAVSAGAAGQSGISYSRDFLKAEQKSSQESLSDIDRNLDAASRLLDAELPGAPEQLVRALFLSDLVGIRLEGQADRISQLKSSFGYVRAEEQRKFTTVYADLRRQLQTAELSAAALSKQLNEGSNGPTILQMFQSKQGDYRNLIRAGLTDVKNVLDDCNRQLVQANASPKARPKSQDAGKTVADVARLKREQAELQVQLTELRRAKESERPSPAVAPPITIIVTNEIVKTIEKPMPAPAPVVVTNTERIFITNIVAAATNPAPLAFTNNARVPERQAINIGETAAGAPTNAATQKTLSNGKDSEPIAQSKAKSPNTDKILATGKVLLPWIGLIGICGLCAGAFSFLIAARTGTVQLALDGKVLEPIEITNNEDAIVLDAQPAVQLKDDVTNKAHLSSTWRGTILRPGQQTVTVNDVAVTTTRRIHRGDTIGVQDGESILRRFDFLGWDRNSSTGEV